MQLDRWGRALDRCAVLVRGEDPIARVRGNGEDFRPDLREVASNGPAIRVERVLDLNCRRARLELHQYLGRRCVRRNGGGKGDWLYAEGLEAQISGRRQERRAKPAFQLTTSDLIRSQ